MPPETEVISCPACRHLVRVPADWLGQTVQCPECKATFTAPKREGDFLGEAVLLSSPDAKSATPPANRAADGALWIPAFGLMLLGIVSLVVNTMTIAEIVRDPAKFEEHKKAQAAEMAKQLGQDPKEVGEENPGARWSVLLGVTIWSVLCGAMSFAGGLSMALRKGYRVAQIGSVLAVLNFAGFCCVPGALVGLWSLSLLRTPEGREHFFN